MGCGTRKRGLHAVCVCVFGRRGADCETSPWLHVLHHYHPRDLTYSDQPIVRRSFPLPQARHVCRQTAAQSCPPCRTARQPAPVSCILSQTQSYRKKPLSRRKCPCQVDASVVITEHLGGLLRSGNPVAAAVSSIIHACKNAQLLGMRENDLGCPLLASAGHRGLRIFVAAVGKVLPLMHSKLSSPAALASAPASLSKGLSAPLRFPPPLLLLSDASDILRLYGCVYTDRWILFFLIYMHRFREDKLQTSRRATHARVHIGACTCGDTMRVCDPSPAMGRGEAHNERLPNGGDDAIPGQLVAGNQLATAVIHSRHETGQP